MSENITSILTAEQRTGLKKKCGVMLQSSAVKPASKSGQLMIHAYWVGALNALNAQDTFVYICLASGRQEDLVEMP